MKSDNRKIGVLLVPDGLNIGGAEHVVKTLAASLDRERFHVVVCTLFSRDQRIAEPLADEIRNLGIRVEQLAMQRWRDLETMKKFWKIIDEESIDIVHAHMIPADFWGCFIARLRFWKKRMRTVYTKHTLLPPTGPAYCFQSNVLNLFLADKIIAISQVMKDDLAKNWHASERKIGLINNCVDTDVFSPKVSGNEIREKLGIPQDAIVIGNTSRFEPLKGYPFFIQIADEIHKKYPSVRFLAFGHGSEKENLLNMIGERNLQNVIRLEEPRRDMPQVLAAMDIYLFTSLWGEGFGLSVVEAMASGKPVVAANVGPNKELIENEVSGFLPTPGNWQPELRKMEIEPIIKKLEFLIQNDELRKSIGWNARQRVIDKFSIEKFIQSHQDLYKELTGNA